jgi:D-glycero-alpha-D-manno-heptose 1-phosphate guanylyltransferase
MSEAGRERLVWHLAPRGDSRRGASCHTAVILAGGLGTRLRSAVADRPKALAEIAGRPFLAWQFDALLAAGVRRVVLCTGYRGEMIEQTFGDCYEGLSISYSHEASPLGTGGALRAALPRIDSATMLVVNGDSLCRADLTVFAQRHATVDARLSLLLTHVADTSRFGRVETDHAGRLTRFVEKGDPHGPGWINAGIYLFQREVMEAIPPDRNVSLEREVFPAWIGRGLYGHRDPGDFLDIGTPESYAAAAGFLAGSACV